MRPPPCPGGAARTPGTSRAPVGPGRRSTPPQQGAHAARGDHLGDRVHGEVVVGEAGDAGPDHLRAGEQRAEGDVPLGEVGLHRPDDVVEPRLGGQVLGKPAQGGHRGVGVTVDQTGQRDLPAGVDPLVGRAPGDGPGVGHLLDDPVADDDGGVLQEDGLFLIVVREDGASGDDEAAGLSTAEGVITSTYDGTPTPGSRTATSRRGSVARRAGRALWPHHEPAHG